MPILYDVQSHDIRNCEDQREACVGRAMAILGLVLTLLAFAILIIGSFLE